MGLASLLSGCFGSPDSSVALTSPAAAPMHDGPSARATTVKTVKRSQRPQLETDDVATVADPMPSPAQIFDFHPPGTKPDSWREPFIIDYSDGPLNRYRTETAAMLKDLQDRPHGQQPSPPSSSAASGQ